jgi:hypothetical protein
MILRRKTMTKWNAITLYDNDERTYYRQTLSWRDGIEQLISMMYENGCDEMYEEAELLEKEYKKVKRLTKKEIERLLSLTGNCHLDYELH